MTNDTHNDDEQPTTGEPPVERGSDPVETDENGHPAGEAEDESSGLRRRTVIAATLGSPAMFGLGFAGADYLGMSGSSDLEEEGSAGLTDQAMAGVPLIAQMDEQAVADMDEEAAQDVPTNQVRVLQASPEVLDTLEREPGDQVRVTRDQDSAVYTLAELEEVEEVDDDDDDFVDDNDDEEDDDLDNDDEDDDFLNDDDDEEDDDLDNDDEDDDFLNDEDDEEDDDLENDDEDDDFLNDDDDEEDDDLVDDDDDDELVDDDDDDDVDPEVEEEVDEDALVRATREGKCRIAFYEDTDFEDDRRWGPLRGDDTCDLADQQFEVEIHPRVPFDPDEVEEEEDDFVDDDDDDDLVDDEEDDDDLVDDEEDDDDLVDDEDDDLDDEDDDFLNDEDDEEDDDLMDDEEDDDLADDDEDDDLDDDMDDDVTGDLQFTDQELAEDGTVTVESVSTGQPSTVAVTYTDGDEEIVAGVAEADDLDDEDVTVEIEDTGGFPGDHTAWVFADEVLPPDLGIGDDATPVAEEALASETAAVSAAPDDEPAEEEVDEEVGLVETFVEGETDIAVLAPHGGQIQPFTDEQANDVHEQIDGSTLWMLEGFGQNTGYHRWFVPSVEISPVSYPDLAALMEEEYDHAVSFHGVHDDHIYVGGTADEDLRQDIVDAIEDALPHDGSPVQLGTHPYAADNEQTLVNRVTGGENGIWIGQPISDRRDSWDVIADAVASVLQDELDVEVDDEDDDFVDDEDDDDFVDDEDDDDFVDDDDEDDDLDDEDDDNDDNDDGL